MYKLSDAASDRVHMFLTADGEYRISRDGAPESVTLAPEHVVNLALSMPALARQILQEKHGSKSTGAVASLQIAQYLVRADALQTAVLMQLKDAEGMEAIYGLPPMHAHELGSRLVAKAQELLTSSDKPKS